MKKTDRTRYTLILEDRQEVHIIHREEKKKKKERTSVWLTLGMVGEIGYTIALPIVGGALLGSYLDRRWSTYPKATLVLLVIGTIVSVLGFVSTIKEIIRKKL